MARFFARWRKLYHFHTSRPTRQVLNFRRLTFWGFFSFTFKLTCHPNNRVRDILYLLDYIDYLVSYSKKMSLAPRMSRVALGVSRARFSHNGASSILSRGQLSNGRLAVASNRSYATPSQVNKMATPVDISPEVRAGRGSKQKGISSGE